MRKLAFLGTVFVLSLALIAGTASSLLNSEDKVEVREELFGGSREAAAGLTVVFHAKDANNNELYWDTVLDLTEGELAPRSYFEFQQFPHARTSEQRDFVTMELRGYSIGLSSDQDLLSGVERGVPAMGFTARDVIDRMALDVAGRTEKGTVRAETVRLRDYTESFEWLLRLGMGDVSIDLLDDTPGLSELFPVEVPEDFYLWVHIGKDDTGAVRCIATSQAEGPEEPTVGKFDPYGGTMTVPVDGSSGPDSRTVAATGNGGLWVYPSVLDAQGRELTRFPDGQGVYFIPIVRSAREDFLDTANARLMYQTDEEPVKLVVSGGNAELVTYVDGDLVLTIIEGESGQVQSRQTLFEDVSDEGAAVAGQDGLRLYTINDGRFALTVWEDGVTYVALTGRFDFDAVYGGLNMHHTLSSVVRTGSTSLAWDGRRLAVAEGEDHQEVIVVDASGVLYHARFDFSPLWNGRSEVYPYNDGRADSDYNEPMRVSFT